MGGSELGDREVGGPPSAPDAGGDESMPTCPTCGSEVKSPATFCENCGARLVPEDAGVEPPPDRDLHEQIFCENCGNPNPGDAAFCESCGQPVEPRLSTPAHGRLRQRRPRTAAAIVFGLVLVGALGVGGVLLLRGGDNPFPTETEAGLLESVPAGISPSCDREEGEKLEGVAAAVFCTPSDPDLAVSYYLFRNSGDMDVWYAEQISFRDVQRDDGDCFAESFQGEGAYLVGEESAGRVLCTVDSDGFAYRVWTDTRLNIGSSAFRLDDDAAALFDSWSCCLGPTE